jgi:hypothetical protein
MDCQDIDSAIAKAAQSLKPEQKRSLQKFVAGMDVFCFFAGKSLCYILLPQTFVLLRKY